jgi:transcription elongation factor Elf1
MDGTDADNRKPNWVRYYQVISYEWECPICDHTNGTKEDPSHRVLRCFKCGSYFDKVRDGGYSEKG